MVILFKKKILKLRKDPDCETCDLYEVQIEAARISCWKEARHSKAEMLLVIESEA